MPPARSSGDREVESRSAARRPGPLEHAHPLNADERADRASPVRDSAQFQNGSSELIVITDVGSLPGQAPTGSASMAAALVHGAQILSQRAVWIETQEEPLLEVPTDEEREGHASPNNHHSNGIQLDAACCGDGETGGTKQQRRPQDVNCEAVPQEAAQRRRGMSRIVRQCP